MDVPKILYWLDVRLMRVEWPERREDVLNGLDALASDPVLNGDGVDQRWPDLTNVVHWVVDDTWWDHADPSESVGTVLVDAAEVRAVYEVVALVVELSERVGADTTDAQRSSDGAWPRVQEAAAAAAVLLRRNVG